MGAFKAENLRAVVQQVADRAAEPSESEYAELLASVAMWALTRPGRERKDINLELQQQFAAILSDLPLQVVS